MYFPFERYSTIRYIMALCLNTWTSATDFISPPRDPRMSGQTPGGQASPTGAPERLHTVPARDRSWHALSEGPGISVCRTKCMSWLHRVGSKLPLHLLPPKEAGPRCVTKGAAEKSGVAGAGEQGGKRGKAWEGGLAPVNPEASAGACVCTHSHTRPLNRGMGDRMQRSPRPRLTLISTLTA